MKTIEFSNGKATIKDFFSRGDKKKYNQEVIKLSEGEDNKISLDKADDINDITVIAAVKELEINGKGQEVTVEVLDQLDTKDYDLILDAANQLINPQIEKK